MALSQKVRDHRQALGLSQERLAQAAGLTWGSIQRLESGQVRDPHYSTLESVAGALGMRVSELMEEPALAVGKGEAPEAGRSAAEVWARIPYGPGGRDEAGKEAIRILSEAADRGEINLDDVVLGYTDTSLDLCHISDAEKHPVYGPWVEFARLFAERWRRKIETGSFDLGEYNEFTGVLEDLQPILLRLGQQDKRENPQYVDSTFGPHIEWASRRIHDLFNPLIRAGTEKFEENDLARIRRERDELAWAAVELEGSQDGREVLEGRESRGA